VKKKGDGLAFDEVNKKVKEVDSDESKPKEEKIEHE